MNSVTISLERFEELLRKEAVYDIKKFEVMQNDFSMSNDKMLFEVDLSARAVTEDDF